MNYPDRRISRRDELEGGAKVGHRPLEDTAAAIEFVEEVQVLS